MGFRGVVVVAALAGVLASCALAEELAAAGSADGAFDWRQSHLGWTVTAVRNYMGMPGKPCAEAGWVFAATAMVADRLAIKQPAAPKVALSDQVIFNCLEGVNPCAERRTIDVALRYMTDSLGVPDRTCIGFRGDKEACSPINTCVNCLPGKCEARPEYIRYPVKAYSRLDASDPQVIAREVRANGPVACELHDGRFGVVVGYAGNHAVMHVKFDLGVAYEDEGFGKVAASELRECWAAQVGTPYHYKDTSVVRERAEESAPLALLGGQPRFEGSKRTHRAAPRLRSELVLTPPPRQLARSELPKSFSWVQRDGLSSVTPVQSHHNGPGYCGACWSMASASAFSDRLKLMRGGPNASDIFVSPQTTVDCVRGPHSTGCDGGDANDVFPHFQKYGTVDETCNVWVAGEQTCVNHGAACKECDAKGECRQVERSRFKVYSAKEWGDVNGEVNMMNEIVARGPIDCGIATPPALDEFFVGDSIICDRDTPPEKWEITHDVSIVGYGETPEGKKYWLVRNSWSTAFGDGGFFKVCRGEDGEAGNMLLESACSWVVPNQPH